jgi:hypothetical protein
MRRVHISDNLEPVQRSGEKSVGRTESNLEEGEAVIADRSDLGSFLRRQLPYVLLLGLAIVGVAYTNMAHQPLVGYWEFLALATGVVCVVAECQSLTEGRPTFC